MCYYQRKASMISYPVGVWQNTGYVQVWCRSSCWAGSTCSSTARSPRPHSYTTPSPRPTGRYTILIQNSMLFTDRRDGTMAALLSTIVLMFLACHSTKIVVNFYEAIQVKTTKSWQFWTNRILLHIQDGAARRAGAPDLGDDAGQSEPPPLDHQLRH